MSATDRTLVLRITTKEGVILHEMIGEENRKSLPQGVTVKSGGQTIREVLDYAETYTFLFFLAKDVALPVAVGILANYIYDRLKSKPDAKLKIGKLDVRIDKGEIERVILENVEVT